MDIDTDKIDEAVLALLHLTLSIPIELSSEVPIEFSSLR